MRTYQESVKSKKTVSSMIERKNENKENKKNVKSSTTNGVAVQLPLESSDAPMNGMVTDDVIMQNRQKLAMKKNSPRCKKLKS